DINDSVEEKVNEVLSENYSRIPVYNEVKDKVVGILHTKNLLKAAHKFGFDKLDIKKIMQEPLFVPETVFIDDLLYEMYKTQ
ncbi:CBS domain-containing protein, partial [Enterococcus faecium]|uniref:CBS domain-containing protein n=1 Tax=Enterococcus faecium TaxID=1352 RepID=UPI003CC56718